MRKTIEILSFIIISVIMGIAITIPLFFFSTAEDVNISFLNIGEINLYKVFFVTLVIAVVIYLMIRKAKEQFRKDDETRKFVLERYPPVISHVFVLFSQIIPSMILFKGLIVVLIVAFGIPRMLGFWINHNVVGISEVTWIDNILNIIITQLIIAPISLIMFSGDYFNRERMNSIGENSKNDDELAKNDDDPEGSTRECCTGQTCPDENRVSERSHSKTIFVKRFASGLLDLLFMMAVVGLIVGISYVVLSSTVYSPRKFSTLISQRPINMPFHHLLVVIGVLSYCIVCIIQWRLSVSFGGTFGKVLMKLKVIDSDRKTVDTKFFLREIILKTFSGFAYLGIISYFVSKNGKMMHDYLIGSDVVPSSADTV